MEVMQNLYDFLNEKQNSIAIISIAETNIKPEIKEFNEMSRSIKNPSIQKSGDGIITQTNY